jgi:hypothetical protein
MPGYLRAEVVLGTQSNWTFQIAANQQVNGQPQAPTEFRLNQNDGFLMESIGVLFYDFLTADGNAGRARARLQTFANPLPVGATSGAIGGFGPTNAPLLEVAYNGFLTFRANDTVYIPGINMNRFKYVGPAQNGLAVSTAAAANVMGDSSYQDGAGLADVSVPMTLINGQANNQFTVQCPVNIDLTTVGARSVVSVLLVQGWYCQNAGNARVSGGGMQQ